MTTALSQIYFNIKISIVFTFEIKMYDKLQLQIKKEMTYEQ